MSEKLPERIQLQNGVVYKLSLFLIDTRDHKGIPRLCTHIPENHQIELHGGEEFLTAYLPESAVNK